MICRRSGLADRPGGSAIALLIEPADRFSLSCFGALAFILRPRCLTRSRQAGLIYFTLNLRKFVPVPISSEEFRNLAARFMESGEQVRASVDGATVYAKRTTLVEMRKLFVELGETTHLAEGPI
jgi:hypothetical protein